MRDLLDRLDGWRDEQIEFLARLVNHDSGTDRRAGRTGVGATRPATRREFVNSPG